MDKEKRKALLQKWQEWEGKLPCERIIRRGGLFGEDIVLLKQRINGLLGYSAPLDVPCWGAEGGF